MAAAAGVVPRWLVPLRGCCRASMRAAIPSASTALKQQRRWNSASASNAEGQKSPSAAAYCRELVRRYDRDHYLATLLLPSTAQRAVFALRALNIEVATIRDSAREPATTSMRFLFWKDAIDALFDQGRPLPQTPVMQELETLQQEQQLQLTRTFLRRLIMAREKDSDVPFASIPQLERYAEDTASTLLYLTLEAMHIRNHTAEHIASHIGKAQGHVTLLRGLPFLAKRNLCRLPVELCAHHGLRAPTVLRGEVTTELQDVVHAVASNAVRHLNTARLEYQADETQLKTAASAYLPAVALQQYLDQLLKADFNPFHPNLAQTSGLLPFRMGWAKFRHSF
ncbi:uncharacterized protein MONBRDRAFT_33464 [Monosiga brevicollis MX1]|uniref:NADH dehydrogenase (Ubiquinone) complex I, assembly factor 6 n=1 Tax=Monosiga brevicollis TaxID=81824 RepID=A9V5I8_MONBE|nr:uncharacterized protein MONBRDRAFT_33464 [Monosiga brevicollis MX1]EDQ87377.1 predicted protein [Monosiga brevicollis MX1]|eukprot:XP_001747990.1 hypothetical protein [Monosiga brevicollis MX1]